MNKGLGASSKNSIYFHNDLSLLDSVISRIRNKLLTIERRKANNPNKCKSQHARNKKRTFKFLAKTIRKGDKSSIVTKFDLFKIARKQKLLCALTGRKLTIENISPDHITPKAKGGQSVPANIQLVTIESNRAKHAMNQNEFIQLCSEVVKNSQLISSVA